MESNVPLYARPEILEESIRRGVEVELSFCLAALGLAPAKPDAHLATGNVIPAGFPDQRLGR
jgi:hypothetical protein